MNKFSLLKNQRKSDIQTHPFPHIVIEDALPIEMAQTLTTDFPLDLFSSVENNKRLDISSANIKKYKSISKEWSDFILYHSSEKFFFEFIDLFQDHLKDASSFKNLLIGRRNDNTFDDCDVLLDAQISINTPVSRKSSVRKVHVDSENKIFSGLFYLRLPHDDSLGGDLNLYSWKSNYSEEKKLKFYREGVDEKHLELHKTITYKNNLAVLFLNSIDALHGVTPKEITSSPRTFVNLVAESPNELYQKHRLHKKLIIKTRKKLSDIKNKFFN